jgi:hypothetical protein
MDLEPCEITTKCSILDSSNKYYYAATERKAEPPSGPLPRPPVSALTKSIETQAQRNNTFSILDFNFPMPASRSRAGSAVASASVDDVGNSGFGSRAPSRLARGTVYSNGSTETIGFFPDTETVKPREFAEDLAFSPRSSQVQSESSSHMEDSKHSQEIGDGSVASLQLYDAHKNLLSIGNWRC